MEALIGIGGMMIVVSGLALFSGVNRRQQARILRDVTRSPTAAPTRRFDLQGDLLPPEETSLGPVDYRRIPEAQPVGYIQTTQTARHTPTVETSFIVPALTAVGTSIAVTLACAVLAWALDWNGKIVAVTFALSLAGGWFWRLGFADRVLWAVESWTGRDLDNDHAVGRPVVGFAVANPGQARATVARETAQNDMDARREALQTFVDRCYEAGTSEGAHDVLASGPSRVSYVACRDTLLKLGLAKWKNPNRPRGGWVLTADVATCKGIVAGHVL